jgi:hypothetical protein
MANCCFVGATVSYRKKEDADKAFEHFQQVLEDHDGRHIPITDAKWFLDVDLRYDEECNALTFNGWVKWALEQYQAYRFLEMLQKFGEVVELDIDYEELAMDIYGRYHYDAGSDTLTDQFVPERHAPNYPEFKTPDEEDEFYSSDAHHNLWEDALQRDGVTVVIDEKTCLEQERERKAAGFSI